ncbi:unnamed protein product [Moneuplotes crassus]|uniref:Uncharacterized protein n=1 Tax=Euplotes crassus TaxID=5936 RepID=A0AAD1XQL6_EUPCR|nr:unnamed protein product [Moneuplotes crassus]
MAKGILAKASGFVTDRIKGFDMYPTSINFTFDGQEEFKTLIGGVVSIVIKVIIILYSYLMLRIMIERKNTQKSVNTVVTDILNDKSPVHLNTSDFSFAFNGIIEGDNSFDLLDNPYVSVELFQWVKNTTTGDFDSTDIPMVRCEKTFFKFYNQTEVEKLGIEDYICPQNRNFLIQGNSLSEDFLYLELNIDKCKTGCPADLDTVLSKIRMEIPFVNTYFNFDDFNSPVKTYIDGRLTFDLLPGYLIRNDVFIQKNEAEYLDSYFAYQPGGTKKEFVGVDRVDQRLAVQHDSVSETIFKMQFVKDEATKSFERTVFSFMEAFGNIGGLFEIIEIAGGFFVGVFSGRMFLFTILSHLYQIEAPDDREEINHRSKSIRMTGTSLDIYCSH